MKNKIYIYQLNSKIQETQKIWDKVKSIVESMSKNNEYTTCENL